MKKDTKVGIIIFICIISITIILTILVVDICSANKSSEISNKIYNKYSYDVDKGINELMEKKEYINTSNNNQVKMMHDLLNLYENNNIIQNLYYDEEGQMYTFTYNYGNIKGALGGVLVKDWNPMMN